MRLLDANLDVRIQGILAEFGIDSRTAQAMGWKELSNGQLVQAAVTAGFTCLLTRDQLFAESAARALKRFPEFAVVLNPPLECKQALMITLTPEQEKLVAQAVETGAYASTDDVLNRALELLRAQDDWLLENRPEIDARIQEAIAQLDRGEGISSQDLERHLARRKEDWLTRQR